MKDSASAASAGAELVLRRFPWAVLVRRPLLPPPETLPDRWLQAAEEEEVELLPFRSPPREENGTRPTQARVENGALRAGKGPWAASVCGGVRFLEVAAWGSGAPELPADFRSLPRRDGVCVVVAGSRGAELARPLG